MRASISPGRGGAAAPPYLPACCGGYGSYRDGARSSAASDPVPPPSMTPRRKIPALVLSCAAAALLLGACGGGSPATGLLLDSTARNASANPVAVSPEPGTPDASPGTQISFLGGPGTTVAGVRVVGSHTGVHPGVLRAYSTGTGESFLPVAALRGGRVGHRQRPGEHRRAHRHRQDELHGRPPGERQPDRVPEQPGRPALPSSTTSRRPR